MWSGACRGDLGRGGGSAQAAEDGHRHIEVLDRFKAEQDRLGTGHGGGVDVARVRELENRVVDLTNRADVLQDALNDVVHIAAQLKADLAEGKKGDGKAELAKFCDNLMSLNLGAAGGMQA